MILWALQDEIKTLIEKQQSLMVKLIRENAIWGHETTNTSLSPDELERQIAALISDNLKVQTLESTIAVIGTMKAGKSTTINALVGDEVLPHRLTAMTTLPTLIRHKPGQKEPVLRLQKLNTFKKLVHDLKAQVNAFDAQNAEQTKLNEAFATLKNTSTDIRHEYFGKEAIHQALFLINDTLRLAGHEGFGGDLDTFLQDFTDVSSLPTVEIEFRCLAGKPENIHAGSLALLDTPGPNEAGQGAVLKHILSEQIQKNASMVLLVMNYTQLNTEQDSDIRNQIKGIKEIFRDRSFVVVNRFDEKKHNDLDEVQTKKLASDLLNDSIDDDEFITPEEVFPVSSHYAFIVERVRQQIDAGVDISSFLRDEQNRDFLKAAFGVLDEDEIDDLTFEQVNTKCDRLLKRSGYESFINNMLKKAYVKTGENSLKAALARLNDNAAKLDRFSTVVQRGLAQEMDELRNSIERTKNLTQAVDALYQKLDEVKKNGTSEYREKAREALQRHVEDIKNSIAEEFANERKTLLGKLEEELEEKSKEKEDWLARPSRLTKKELWVIENDLENLRSEINKHSKGNDGVLYFGEDREAALDFSRKAGNVVNALFSSMVGSLQDQLNILEEKTKNEIQVELFGQLESLCKDYEAEMQEKGYEFSVSLSENFSLDLLSDAVTDVNANDAIETYSESLTRKYKKIVRREGWLHTTLKVLSFGLRDDYEEETASRTHKVSRYRIVLDEYVKNARCLADKFYADIDDRLVRQFEEKLVPAVDDVFSGVIAAVKNIEEALEQSKKLKIESVAVISEVKVMIGDVRKENVIQLDRIRVAKLGIDCLASGR